MKALARALVLVLAVVIGAAPVLLDNCPMTCRGESSGVAGAQAPLDHSCHHSNHSGPLCAMQPAPAACGHDHSPVGAVIRAAGDTASPLKPAFAPVALIRPGPVFTSVTAMVEVLPSGRSPGSTVTSSLAVPLRI
jgi:hypothetical protein